MEEILSILENFKKDFHEYALADTDVLKFQEGVAASCRMNYCGMYNRTWMCPPAVGNWQELEKEFRKYRRFFVFTTKHDIEDSFDIEGMGRGKDEHKLVQDRVQEALRGLPCRILGAGGCGICKTCTYPDAPCRFPDKRLVSMEAAGLYVAETCTKAGIPYNHGKNTIAFSSCVLYNDGQ